MPVSAGLDICTIKKMEGVLERELLIFLSLPDFAGDPELRRLAASVTGRKWSSVLAGIDGAESSFALVEMGGRRLLALAGVAVDVSCVVGGGRGLALVQRGVSS